MKRSVAILLVALAAGSARGQVVITEHYSFDASLTPQDGLGAPASDTRSVASSIIHTITDLAVSVRLVNSEVAGAYNGDYYISLQHSTGFAVLLNRPGRHDGASPTATFGYGDNGLNVTFSDAAVDIHNYRVTLSGNHITPIDPTYQSSLTGLWAPDGRATSPLAVLDTDPRTALLNSFSGLAANGAWTLQVIDFNGGNVATLENWGLHITGVAVPEPAATCAMTALGLGIFALRRWVLNGKNGASCRD